MFRFGFVCLCLYLVDFVGLDMVCGNSVAWFLLRVVRCYKLFVACFLCVFVVLDDLLF